MYSTRTINRFRYDSPELTEQQIRTDLCTVFWVSLLWGPLVMFTNLVVFGMLFFMALVFPFLIFEIKGTVLGFLIGIGSIALLVTAIWAWLRVPWGEIWARVVSTFRRATNYDSRQLRKRTTIKEDKETSWKLFKAWLIGLKHQACFSIELDTGYSDVYEELDGR